MNNSIRLSLIALVLETGIAHGGVILTTGLTAAQFAAYQTGKTVQTFDSVTGDPGFNISNFNSNVNTATLTGSGATLFQTWGAAHDGFIATSGGSSPAGIFKLTNGLAGATSGTDVLAPLAIDMGSGTISTCFNGPTCLMAFELIFTQPVSTVGFYMNSPIASTGALLLDNDASITVDTSIPQIQRSGETVIFSQASIPAGYVTLTSTSANINVVSFIMSGTSPTFIDDFTYSRGSASVTTPEPATFALAALFLAGSVLLRRKMK